MITIESIGQRHGYSSYDHLLDDGPLQDLIGRSFRSVADVRRIANAIQSRTADRRCGSVPIAVELRMASGALVAVDV